MGDAIGDRDFEPAPCRCYSLRATSESGCYRSSVSTTLHHSHIGTSIRGHDISHPATGRKFPVPTSRAQRGGANTTVGPGTAGRMLIPNLPPRSRVHWAGQVRNCWSAPAGNAHGCETERSDHHRDPRDRQRLPPNTRQFKRPSEACCLCAMCFKNQEVFVSEGVELLLLDDRYGRKVGLCRLASQHCNPAVSC